MWLFIKRQLLFLVFALSIVFTVIFTQTLIFTEVDHNCISEHESCQTTTEDEICQPCLQIEIAKNFLKILRQADINASHIPYSAFPSMFIENNSEFNSFLQSPVDLKVRFNT